jgi:hypothetical protein
VASFLQVSPPKLVHASPLHFRATCHTNLILSDFIARTIVGEQYRSRSFSLWSFLHSPVTSSLLNLNTLLNTLFSNTPVYVPPSMSANKFHTHIKTGKNYSLYNALEFKKTNGKFLKVCREWGHLTRRELRSSLTESHSFLSLTGDATMVSSKGTHMICFFSNTTS